MFRHSHIQFGFPLPTGYGRVISRQRVATELVHGSRTQRCPSKQPLSFYFVLVLRRDDGSTCQLPSHLRPSQIVTVAPSAATKLQFIANNKF